MDKETKIVRIHVKPEPLKPETQTPASGDEAVLSLQHKAVVSPQAPISGDEAVLSVYHEAGVSSQTPVSGDEAVLGKGAGTAVLRSDCPVSADEVRQEPVSGTVRTGLNIPVSADEETPYSYPHSLKISAPEAVSSDENTIASAGMPARISMDIPVSSDEASAFHVPEPVKMRGDIVSSEDEASAFSRAKSLRPQTDSPVSSDETRSVREHNTVPVRGDIAVSNDERSAFTPERTIPVSTGITQSGDETRAVIERGPVAIKTDIPASGDEYLQSLNAVTPVVSKDIAASPDELSPFLIPKSPTVSMEIAASSDETRVVGEPELARMHVETPASTDEISVVQDHETPHEFRNIPVAEDESINKFTHPGIRFRDIPVSDDESRIRYREFSFTGKWWPKDDPLNIGAENYSVLKNYRYTDTGLEGVGPFSRINTSALGVKIRNGIQLRTNYTAQRSAVVVQAQSAYGQAITKNEADVPDQGAFDTGVFNATGATTLMLTTAYATSPVNVTSTQYATGAELADEIETKANSNLALTGGGTVDFTVTYSTTTHKFTIAVNVGTISYVNTGSTLGSIIGFTANQGPATSVVSDTEVTNDSAMFVESTSSELARFAYLPQGAIGICDGVDNKIWAGDEKPVDACLVTKLVAVDAYVLGNIASNGVQDLTKQINNTLTDDNNVITMYSDTTFGDATTVYSVVFASPYTTFTRTSGTHPNFLTNGLVVNASVKIASPFDALNIGTFLVHSCTDDILVLNNAAGKTETVTSGASSVKTSDRNMILVGSTRRLSSVKLTVSTANTFTSSMTAYCSNGFAFSSMGVTDGTTSGGKTLSQNGTISWPTMITDGTGGIDAVYGEKPMYIGGYYLYFYLFVPTYCNAKISNITANAAFQSITDVWDGVYRSPTYCVVKKFVSASDNYYEYTLEIVDESAQATPLGAKIDALDWSTHEDSIILVLDERTTALYLKMIDEKFNTNATTITVDYWNGIAWTAAPGIVDRTLDSGGTKSLTVSGVVSWGYIDDSLEKKHMYRGRNGYAYRLRWSAALSNPTGGDDIIIDVIKGVPRARSAMLAYTFPFQYRNHPLLCGCIGDGELNRVDYGPANTVDVYNGDDSSKHDNSQSLYFGGKDKLTGAAELFDRYGLNLASGALFFKNSEIFLLTGSAPTGDDPFKIDKISGQIGCPCPLTITPMEVSFTNGDQPPANVVGFISGTGPMLYCNTSLYCVPGIEPYFDTADSRCVLSTLLKYAAAGYNATYKEWNILLPSGSAATANNVWIVYDMVRHKWYERVSANTDDFPQGFIHIEDTYGNKYLYAYSGSGYLLRLEYNVDGLYDGTTAYGITNTVKTADILPLETVWEKSFLRRIKTLFATNAEGLMTITHYANGDSDGTTIESTAGNMITSDTSLRYRNLITQVYTTVSTGRYALTGLSHALQLVVTGATSVKPKLINWGLNAIPDKVDE